MTEEQARAIALNWLHHDIDEVLAAIQFIADSRQLESWGDDQGYIVEKRERFDNRTGQVMEVL